MSDKEITKEQDALDIVNDPKNRTTAAQAACEHEEKTIAGISRRDMLKYGGAAAAALSVPASAVTGFKLARHGDAYTGWGRQRMGEDQFFNREPFRAEVAAMMTPTSETSRPEWYHYYLERFFATNELIAQKKWHPKDGVDAMPGHLGEFYRANPDKFEHYMSQRALIAKRNKYLNDGGYYENALHHMYNVAYRSTSNTFQGAVLPENPTTAMRLKGEPQPPEKWDFRHISKKRKKFEFKSPAHASEFIKTLAHRFGASFVGVTPFNPLVMAKDFMHGFPDRGYGYGDKIPAHWKSVIIFAIPSEWDKTQSSASFLTAQDAYFRVRMVATLLERYIQELGYPSRPQTPGGYYEIPFTPFILASGLGEYARAGNAMIPEVGYNFRSAAVITDIEFEYDKPINIGMAKFCMKCKICADTCPSGAIETGEVPKGDVRGTYRWYLDSEKCHTGWLSTMGSACGTCVAVCPFTRKNTWIHAISRELDARDVTGLVGEALLTMQLNFFKYPTAEEFRGEYAGGENAVYHNPPKWQMTEEWFDDIDVTWEWEGMH